MSNYVRNLKDRIFGEMREAREVKFEDELLQKEGETWIMTAIRFSNDEVDYFWVAVSEDGTLLHVPLDYEWEYED